LGVKDGLLIVDIIDPHVAVLPMSVANVAQEILLVGRGFQDFSGGGE
jgi:hypothetical protein